jgi:antitoxin component YwqK of YwqJK toxin-antitoxin module
MKLLLTISITMLVSCTSIVPMESAVSSNDIVRDHEGKVFLNGHKFTGTVLEYFTSGAVASRSNYKNGQLDGPEYIYYETGQLKSRRFYRNGEKHGTHRGFFEDGALRFVYRFRNGLSIGNHKVWYEDGQLAQDLNYIDGYPFGSQKVWRRDGKIRSNYVVREDGRRYGLVGIKRCKNIDIEAEKVAPLTAQNYVQ